MSFRRVDKDRVRLVRASDVARVAGGAPSACAPSKQNAELVFEPRAKSLVPDAPFVARKDGPPMPAMLRLLSSTASSLGIAPSPAAEQIVRRSNVAAIRPAIAGKAEPSSVKLLADNTDAWLSCWHVLQHGKGDVDASFYVLDRDLFGLAFLGQLYRRAKNGDRVRLLVDAIGSFGRGFSLSVAGQDYLQELVETGRGDVRVYNPMHHKLWKMMIPGRSFFEKIAATHGKLVRTADLTMTGGRNIGRDYFSSPEDFSGAFTDTDLLLRGREFSKNMKTTFEAEFERDDLHFKVPVDRFGNWFKKDIQLLGAYLLMDTWLNSKPPPGQDPKEWVYRTAIARLPEEGVTRAPGWIDRLRLKKLAAQLVEEKALSGANIGYDVFRDAEPAEDVGLVRSRSAASRAADDPLQSIVTVAGMAEKKLLIRTPYLMLTKEALAALEAAGKRGVEITIVTTSPANCNHASPQLIFLDDWPHLLATVPNLKLYAYTGDRMVHSKVVVVDEKRAGVGSYNLDVLSEHMNGEIATTVGGPALAKRLLRGFEADLANPRLGLREYTIQREEDGRPVLREGAPVVTFGAKDHLPEHLWRRYGKFQAWLMRPLRKLLPMFRPLWR